MIARRILIAGVSTRAAAESAARAGFAVTAIDAFGDIDQHPAVHALSLRGTFTARAAADAVRGVPCDAAAYLAPFENHPDSVRALAANRTLWGNGPEVLRRVRDPLAVRRTLRQRGFSAPDVRTEGPPGPAYGESARWLLKPLASGGGYRIREWNDGDEIPRGWYLQERVEGLSASVVFAAAGRRAVPLAVFRQLIGDGAFGASGFQYCGNILSAGARQSHLDHEVVQRACALARAAADEFQLVGVNGIDFVVREAIPHVTEINPRWCASMELVERAYGLSVFGIHGAACDAGMLPYFDLRTARRAGPGAYGKAVVFAREDVVTGDTRGWIAGTTFDDGAFIRDIPQPRTEIRAGRPVCTVFAESADAAACYTALVERANRVYADLAAWRLSGGAR